MKSIVMDGRLERAEALASLQAAAQAATGAMPDALLRCQTDEQRQRVIADRDLCQLAYTRSLARSLAHTGPLFEQLAKDLEKEASQVAQRSRQLQSATEAVQLLAEGVRLASALALAFV